MIDLAQSSLWLTLLAILISSIFYLILCYQKGNQKFRKIARTSYIVFIFLTTLSSFFLMYFFITHNYRLEYVIQYSSSDLPLHYLISSFWAGQEGSFLLWVFIGAWLGMILLFKSRRTESHVMVIYNLQLIFLSILLIKQSPFRTVSKVFNDGLGLNMLLQDPWMVIHPPIVFLGYAAFAIPFAIAMASLWRREYSEWVKQGLSWIAFSFVTLGAGIIIGGIWSYKVLGWGGYWGWDPVENASLLPWLAGIALLHGMILQKSTNRFAKTNYFLAAFSFVLILYSTFLTRSGVLSNFSVHSFVDLGITGWLVLFILVFIGISVFLIISRAKEIPQPKRIKNKETSIFSLEFGLIAAVILLFLSTIVTGLGTSAPLITRLFEKTSKVSNQFYINTNLPIAILIGLLLSYVPLLKWGKNHPATFLPQMILGLITAILSSIITLINGFPGILIFLMVLFAGFMIGVNLELLIRRIRKNFVSASAAIAHLGLGLMFIGFIASTGYDKAERVALPQGELKDVFDYKIKFIEPKISHFVRGTRLYLPVEIQKGNRTTYGEPDIYVEAKSNKEDNRFHHPFIKRGIWSDLYVSPEGYEPGTRETASDNHLVIKKGETVNFKDYNINFVGYQFSGMGGTHVQEGTISVGANLIISFKKEKPISLTPVYIVGQQNVPGSRVKLPGPEEAYLTIVGINADQKTIHLHYDGPESEGQEPQQPPMLYAEISIKPGMPVLWLGVTLLLLAGIMSIYRRWPRKE